MLSPALFRTSPQLQSQFAWTPLIVKPTPVHKMAGLGVQFGHSDLYVKREDATDSVYGGNKVRNLEFILGRALARNRNKLITLAPVGSNFVAALAAQARKLGLGVEVMHFSPVRTPQIESHFNFSRAQGASIRVFSGRVGTVPAALAVFAKQLFSLPSERAEWVAPGGSSPTGALGHVNALLELKEQITRAEVCCPDVIVVGAGTCGTMAGLTVGLRLAGLKTRLIGIRCVDGLICNRYAIARLANALFQKLGMTDRVSPKEVELVTSAGHEEYGVSDRETKQLIHLFAEEEGIRLDTTYTAKVGRFLTDSLSRGDFRGLKVLYWHTFSPKALEYPIAPVTKQWAWEVASSPVV